MYVVLAGSWGTSYPVWYVLRAAELGEVSRARTLPPDRAPTFNRHGRWLPVASSSDPIPRPAPRARSAVPRSPAGRATRDGPDTHPAGARAAAHVPVARADHPEGAACRSDPNYGGRALSQLPWPARSVQLTRPPRAIALGPRPPRGLQEPVPVHARCHWPA